MLYFIWRMRAWKWIHLHRYSKFFSCFDKESWGKKEEGAEPEKKWINVCFIVKSIFMPITRLIFLSFMRVRVRVCVSVCKFESERESIWIIQSVEWIYVLNLYTFHSFTRLLLHFLARLHTSSHKRTYILLGQHDHRFAYSLCLCDGANFIIFYCLYNQLYIEH